MQIHCAQRAVMPLVIIAMIIAGGIGRNPCNAQETAHKTVKNVLYRSDDGQLSDGMREKCRLDVLYPADVPDFATIVWFHGGGLTGGERSIRRRLFAMIWPLWPSAIDFTLRRRLPNILKTPLPRSRGFIRTSNSMADHLTGLS